MIHHLLAGCILNHTLSEVEVDEPPSPLYKNMVDSASDCLGD